MPEIFLHSSFLGIDSNIHVDESGKIKTTKEKFNRKNTFVVSGLDFFEGDLIDLLPAVGQKCPHFVGDELSKSYRHVYGDNVNWFRALGKPKFVKTISEYLGALQELVTAKDERKYLPTLMRCREILGKLENSHVDRDSLRRELLSRDTSTLQSLKPIDYEECDIVRYSHESQTGRLIVKNGPRVLTLNKEDRKLFKPSINGNVIAQIDFVSLEPRVAYLLTRDSSPRDIYQEMGSSIKSSASRASLKIATLSTLYGSSKIDPQLSRSVYKFFAVDKIKEERLSDDRLFNLYGRPLNPEEEWLRLSHYIQSTAVDVALLGFTSFSNQWEIKPLFLIHDALVFECDKETYESMSSNDLFVDVEPLGRFYLGLTEFGKDN